MLALAERAIGVSDPNPRVGCVILAAGSAGGAGGSPVPGEPEGSATIGQGHTQQRGGPHAEVMALADARALGHSLRGAEVFVSLEPCAHVGRTPPCTQALIAAGVGRVWVALLDPNPLVSGQGVAQLRAAGIAVEVLAVDSPVALAARALNIGFLSRMVRGLPWVRLKVAVSLDGKTALPDGSSQWITGPAARADGHAWRARAGMVLTGVGTVLADDPLLTVREHAVGKQPALAVVDSLLRTPPSARLFTVDRPVTLLHADPAALPPHEAAAMAARAEALRSNGATLVACGAAGGAAGGAMANSTASLQRPSNTVTHAGVDLPAMLRWMAAQEVNELHIEAGPRLNGALLAAGLVDELLVYMAPRLLGTGRDMAAFGPLANLADAPALRWVDTLPVGEDLRLRAVLAQRDRF